MKLYANNTDKKPNKKKREKKKRKRNTGKQAANDFKVKARN
jgi:hypothetical protein